MRTAILISLSIIGGLLAALIHAASVGPDAGFKTLTLPGVFPIATAIGAAAGLILSPIVIWAMRDQNPKIALSWVFAISFATVIISILLHVPKPIYVSLAVTVLTLCLFRIIGRRKRVGDGSQAPNPDIS